MPTQEERLTALEQAALASQKFQQQAAAHIRETEENTTILLGVIRSQGRDIKQIVERLDTMDDQFKRIDTRLDAMDTRLSAMDTRLSVMDSRFDRVDTHLNRLETLLTQILARLPDGKP